MTPPRYLAGPWLATDEFHPPGRRWNEPPSPDSGLLLESTDLRPELRPGVLPIAGRTLDGVVALAENRAVVEGLFAVPLDYLVRPDSNAVPVTGGVHPHLERRLLPDDRRL